MRKTLLVLCVCLLAAGLAVAGGQADTGKKAAAAGNLAESLKADAVAVTLKAPDGQPLVFPGFVKKFPKRPDNPEAPQREPGPLVRLQYAG
jgi:hypothetical protein